MTSPRRTSFEDHLQKWIGKSNNINLANHRTLGKFFDSGVLDSDCGSSHRQLQANITQSTVDNQRKSIGEIKQKIEEIEDQPDEQSDPFYIKPEPEAQSQPESQPEPTQATKDKRSYRFTPFVNL
ncbi:hypothetical protein B9Z55_023399 [Caenorhabditis nigoni]|uniref:Uncharacterized protein n=1 Tax=Caenorhabditis nigoni TaxID=1611254 RepID=A0A2G5SPR6_9PELO|nr:hypothetical protein B9Z55_023399 [Caenorhabditis nigoni]